MGTPVEVDASEVQGMTVDVDDTNGVIVSFGKPLSKLILKNPPGNSDRVYFTLGKAGMLAGVTPKTDDALRVLYEYLEPGETYEHDNAGIHPTSVELLCAATKSVSRVRFLLT